MKTHKEFEKEIFNKNPKLKKAVENFDAEFEIEILKQRIQAIEEEKYESCHFCKREKPLSSAGLCEDCARDINPSAFNPSEKDLLRIAKESSCLQRIEMKIWDYMKTPMPKRDCVSVAMEIFKDVEKTIRNIDRL